VLVVPVVALLGLAVWAALDMRRRAQPGWLWGLLIFFAPVLGVLLWLALRNNWPRVDTHVEAEAG